MEAALPRKRNLEFVSSEEEAGAADGGSHQVRSGPRHVRKCAESSTLLGSKSAAFEAAHYGTNWLLQHVLWGPAATKAK